MRFSRNIIMLSSIMIISTAYAASNETLPSYHWSYTYIHALQDRSYCLNLNRLNEPYTRGMIAKSLIDCYKQVKREKEQGLSVSIETMEMLQVLNKEFRDDIQSIKSMKNEKQDKQKIDLFTYLTPVFDKSGTESISYRGRYRTGAGVNFNSHMYVYTGYYLNQYDYLDSDYMGYKWRGLAAYTEQAYLQGTWGKYHFKFGRDFLKWGNGRSGTLTLSNQYRPLDQIFAATQFGPFQFSYFISKLNQMKTSSDSTLTIPYNRYLSGHRLDLCLWSGRFQVGISELILYGGAFEPMNMTYLNPFLFYHGEKKNRAGDNNVLPTIDISAYPIRNLKCYGSILIDDIQVEKTGPGDLEPNEIGWLAGAGFSEIVGIKGLSMHGEFVRVPNRTYKTSHFWEQFTTQNQPLGHPLDSDFEYWETGLQHWISAFLLLEFNYSQFKKGEGSLFKPWDEPWNDYTVEEGYTEPYLTGVVETQKAIDFSIRYFPSTRWGIEGSFKAVDQKNNYHVYGKNRKEISFKIGIWLRGKLKIPLSYKNTILDDEKY